MSHLKVIQTDCDRPGCDNTYRQPTRVVARNRTAQAAGWGAWTRDGKAFDLCPECDATMHAFLQPAPQRLGVQFSGGPA